jgi:exonuclease SbcD
VLRLATRDGAEAVVALVPFVSQRGVLRTEQLFDLAPDQRATTYAERIGRVVRDLGGRFADDTVNLVLAHLFVAGGVLGGGERSAHTILDYWVPPTMFPAAAQYVALGHLHRAQAFPGAGLIRYAGSPLALDFGEESDRKSVTLVEVEPGTAASSREVPLAGGRPLRTVRGTLEELRALAGTTGDAWLRVEVHERVRAGLADEVRQWFPDAVDVRVVVPDAGDAGRPHAPRRTGRSPGELFRDFCAEQQVADERVPLLFDELLDEVFDSSRGATAGAG